MPRTSMLRLPPMSVTTRHSASAYPFQCQAGLPLVGPIIGQEVLGQGMFCHDPFCLYETETLLSPCMLVSGNKGYGKSAFVKAYLHRQAMAGKWMAILDPKGEYLDLAERDQLSVLALRPGGPVRLNPLEAGPGAMARDPSIAGTAPVDVRGRRIGVVVALAESATGRPVTSDERSVVTAALMELERRATGRRTPRDGPTLRHVMDLLMEPTEGMANELRTDAISLATDARSVARGLHRLVEGDLAGMFDGESTATVDWSGPGIVVDLSAVLQSPAFSSILVCAGAWLAQVVARKDRQRIIVVDECWKAIRDAGFVAWGEETQKLSRGYGVQFVTIVQRISDLASQADDGTATAKRAQGFVTEAETKVTFNLSGGEARTSRDVMDWTESETQLVPRLPRGRALWRVGEHGAIVQTILSPRDIAMCDSNQAMRRDSNQALASHQ
jgi:type IV secretory pathway VirB4 component